MKKSHKMTLILTSLFSVLLSINAFQVPTTDDYLAEFCYSTGIPKASCKCQNFTITFQTFNISLCDIIKKEFIGDTEILKLLQRHASPNIAARYCKHFNLSPSNCTCHSVSITFNGGRALTSCRHEVATTEKPKLVIKDVYDLCKAFMIPRENCSCDLFTSTSTDVCKYLDNTQEVRTLYTHHYQYAYATVATITSLIGILGNLLVICVQRKRISPNFNKLITHLAFYDLTFALLQVVYVLPKFWTPKWLYGGFLCKIFHSVEYLSAVLAVGVILIISIERYIKIFYPLYIVTQRKLDSILIFNFVIGFASVVPLFAHSNVNNSLGTCRVSWPRAGLDAEVYNMTIFVGLYIIPILIVTILYAKIIRYLMLNSVSVATGNQPIFQQNNQDNKRITAAMVSVMIVFIIFVFPKHIVLIYFDSKGWNQEFISSKELSLKSYFILMYIAHIPYLFHVCTNPLIYSITDPRWRHDLKGLVFKIKNGGKDDSITMVTIATANPNETIGKNHEEGQILMDEKI